MDPSSGEKKNLFCIWWKENDTSKRFYVNFISDTREDSSIKLPQFMIDLARQPEPALSTKQASEMVANVEMAEAAIRSSLKSLYGNKLPKIYLTEEGEDLVMDMYIYEAHSKALMDIPIGQMGKRNFLYCTLSETQEHVAEVVDDRNLTVKLDKLYMENLELNSCKPTGRRAKRDQISALLLGPHDSETILHKHLRQISGLSVSTGEHLLCIGMEDRAKRRSVYYNIVASDHSESIRLPDLMIRASIMPRIEATTLVESISSSIIKYQVSSKIAEWLNRFYSGDVPPVCVARDNNRDLVIDVPIHVENAPMLKRCLIGELRSALFATITTYYRQYFLDLSHRTDLKLNESMWPIFNKIRYMRPGRHATREEVSSLFLMRS